MSHTQDSEFSDMEIIDDVPIANAKNTLSEKQKKAFDIYLRLVRNSETKIKEITDYLELTNLNLRNFEEIQYHVCPNDKCQKKLKPHENIYKIPKLYLVYCDNCCDDVLSSKNQLGCAEEGCHNRRIHSSKYCSEHKCIAYDCPDSRYTNTETCWHHFLKPETKKNPPSIDPKIKMTGCKPCPPPPKICEDRSCDRNVAKESNYCSNHKCYFETCLRKRYWHGYCSHHKDLFFG